MLPDLMRRPLAALLCLLAALALALALGACGEEESEAGVPKEAVEGEPLELGELGYNVQITRFLNPDDVEDRDYLVGLPPAPPDTDYLGVFLVIKNEGDEELPSAGGYTVFDTLENEFEPLESESPFALEIGAPVAPEGQLPIPDSTADTGPNQGSLLIFNVDETVSENRPLKMEIHSVFGTGEVLLDI